MGKIAMRSTTHRETSARDNQKPTTHQGGLFAEIPLRTCHEPGIEQLELVPQVFARIRRPQESPISGHCPIDPGMVHEVDDSDAE